MRLNFSYIYDIISFFFLPGFIRDVELKSTKMFWSTYIKTEVYIPFEIAFRGGETGVMGGGYFVLKGVNLKQTKRQSTT